MFDNLRHSMDLDDLLFEKRNREYGAYQLRKRYNAVMVTGLIIAVVIVCSAIIIPFIISSRSDDVLGGGSYYVKVQMESLEMPPDEIYVPPPPPPPQAATIQESQKYVPPVVVDSLLDLEAAPAITDQFLNQTTSDLAVSGANGVGEDLLTGQVGFDTDEPYIQVEVMPAFRGGNLNKFRDWVQKRTPYPQAAVDNRIRGTVYLTFIVEKDGSVSNVTVVKGVDPLLDNEAVKSISESPKWTPGLQSGQPVRVRFSIPLNFMF
jgi:periplasmic protein TonB